MDLELPAVLALHFTVMASLESTPGLFKFVTVRGRYGLRIFARIQGPDACDDKRKTVRRGRERTEECR